MTIRSDVAPGGDLTLAGDVALGGDVAPGGDTALANVIRMPGPGHGGRFAGSDLAREWVAAEGVRAPVLGADGRLAYIADGPAGPALWIRDASDRRRRVDTGPGHVRAALWAPAGDLIAVHVAPGGGELTEVRVVAVDGDGGSPRRLAGGD
ncbi:hypothetical protein ND748_19195, partial [Frankia sp. AiPs1]|uniref:TolB family protein n=1 Tax=Frankia sp. AiPs1 TaxID=573493 RepID=UPI0035AC29AC|nr:hypothetical protein [Frankia sp. AiPs1]